MSIIQVQGGGGRVASSRTSFVGVRVPPEIKAMAKKTANLDKDIFRKLLKCEYPFALSAQAVKCCRETICFSFHIV
jgi:hypothetical protein